jgi:2-polyprenyl-3-methyl-5-hydroxy-6-metoxy-1,4-benzoquinol methylase
MPPEAGAGQRPPLAERSSPCPLCGASSFVAWFEITEHSGARNGLVRCRSCDLVVAAREPSRQQLDEYYAQYSYGHEEAWKLPPATEASLAHLARRLEPYRSEARLLDVGCGAGAILGVMARHGWVTEGTELSGVAAERLRGQGHRIHLGAIEELDLEQGAYDVVILSEIIEHLLAPGVAVAAAARLLRPGGAAYITTPNFDALSRRLLGPRWRVIELPEHVSYFNRRSLRALLKRAGLEIVSLATEGVSPFELVAQLRAKPAAASVARGTEALRELSVGRGPLAPLKGAVNAALRLSGLGDTLKALATRTP